jgi:hypothetical protein
MIVEPPRVGADASPAPRAKPAAQDADTELIPGGYPDTQEHVPEGRFSAALTLQKQRGFSPRTLIP